MRVENRELLLGIILGLFIGGTAAVLLSPARGEETRQRLRSTANETTGKVKEVVEKGQQYIQTVQSQIAEAIEAGRQAAREKRIELEAEVRAQTELESVKG